MELASLIGIEDPPRDGQFLFESLPSFRSNGRGVSISAPFPSQIEMEPGFDHGKDGRSRLGLFPAHEKLLVLGVTLLCSLGREPKGRKISFAQPGAVVQALAAGLQLAAERFQSIEVSAPEVMIDGRFKLGTVLFAVEPRLVED